MTNIQDRIKQSSKAEIAQRQIFLEKIKNDTPKEVLSVSVGNGVWDYLILKKFPQAKIIATDIVDCPVEKNDLQLLKKTRRWEFVKVEPDVIIPFADKSFDLIFHHDVFEHVNKPYLFLKEQHRVLKDGGTIIFSTPNLFRPGNILKLFLGTLKFPVVTEDSPVLGRLSHVQEFTSWNLKSYLEEIGFKKIEIIPTFFGIHPINFEISSFPKNNFSKSFCQIITVVAIK